MAEHQRMKDKRVLVTGSGTGIGRGMAVEFAREGAEVALHYCHSDAGARSAVEEIRAFGGKAEAFKADLNDVAQAMELPAKVIDYLGGLDVLVNNAGITMNQPFLKVAPEQYDTLYNVNVRAMFFVTQTAVGTMIEQGKGAVINITSNHAFVGATEHSVYAGTRAAVVGYTRTLSIELIQKGVRVNAIASGWVLQENQRAMLPADFDEAKAGMVLPAGFIGQPEDIGRLAIFLASDRSRYIIGQTIICDGGQTALMAAAGDFRQPMKETYGKGYVPGI